MAVNGDVMDATSARAALSASGAAAVMLGRGVYGRPWFAAALERALADGGEAREPDGEARLAVVLDHLHASLAFYGDVLGLRVFRKHLGWYVERGPGVGDAAERRRLRSQLCRLERVGEVEAGLVRLWADGADERLAVAA